MVLYPNIARKLIKKGYRIIDIKPKKENNCGSLFVFEVTGDFEKDFNSLMKSLAKDFDAYRDGKDKEAE